MKNSRKIFVFGIILLLCVPSLVAKDSQPSNSIGAGLRFGPYSFIGLDISYQHAINQRLSVIGYGGYVADLEINLFGGSSSSNDYHAIETGIGVKYAFLDGVIQPYGIGRVMASIPVVESRDFILYGTGGVGADLKLGRLSVGAEIALVLFGFGGESSTTLLWESFLVYLGPTVRFHW